MKTKTKVWVRKLCAKKEKKQQTKPFQRNNIDAMRRFWQRCINILCYVTVFVQKTFCQSSHSISLFVMQVVQSTMYYVFAKGLIIVMISIDAKIVGARVNDSIGLIKLVYIPKGRHFMIFLCNMNNVHLKCWA